MSLASRIVTALLGLALIWYYWPFGSGEDVVTAPDSRLFTKPGAPVSQDPAPTNAATKTTGATPSQEQPGGKAQGGENAGPEHVAALPATEVAIMPPPKPKLYYRVVVRDGGTLEANGVVIALGGIAARKASAQCEDGKGRAWACGARARSALRRLIRGRAVTCDVPASGKHKSLTARCTVGGTDLSTWMVAQGWAKPKSPKEPALAAAAAAARKKRIGIWRGLE